MRLEAFRSRYFLHLGRATCCANACVDRDMSGGVPTVWYTRLSFDSDEGTRSIHMYCTCCLLYVLFMYPWLGLYSYNRVLVVLCS